MSTMTPKSLWGELPVTSEVRTPVTVLREQAAIFNEKYQGVLSAELRQARIANEKLVAYTLSIVAPALNGYSVEILEVIHGVDLKKIDLFSDAFDKAPVSCGDMTCFEEAVASVLGSARTKRIIEVLLAQAVA